MKRPIFGRRQPQPSSSTSAGTAPQGHKAVLEQLRRIAAEQPQARTQLVGRLLFDMTCKMITTERGVRMEDLLAILASCGGFSCLLAAWSETGGAPPFRGRLSVIQGSDQHRYFFGDLPNRYLIEDKFALLSLALGAAQACGGAVSIEMVHQTMVHVISTVGGADFGKPRLPADHLPGDLPFNYVRFLWPKIAEALTLYEVPPTQRPEALGFALQHAIEAGRTAIDPTLAALIVTECAVPMAKVDPERVAKSVR